jgi:hypothetical protein
LADVAEAAAGAGDLDRAQRLAREAETIAAAVSDPARQAWVLAGLAKARRSLP